MDTDNPKIHTIDIRGQICPSCLLIALKEVNAQRDPLQSGDTIIHILTDSRQSTNTIPGSVQNMGYQANIHKHDSHYCIEVRK